MITIYQADKENNHIRRIETYTPPATTYIGLSTAEADEFPNSGEVPADSEPTLTGYARIEVQNNSNTWNTSSGGKITNKIELKFPEIKGVPGEKKIVKWVFEAETIDGTNNVMYYAKLEPEIELFQFLTIRFNPDDIEFTRTNPTTSTTTSGS